MNKLVNGLERPLSRLEKGPSWVVPIFPFAYCKDINVSALSSARDISPALVSSAKNSYGPHDSEANQNGVET